MTMKREELHQTLQQLHAELKRAPALNEADRRLLETVGQDIERTLQQRTQAPNVQSSEAGLLPQLEEQIARFESTHPELSLALTRLVELLNRMGL